MKLGEVGPMLGVKAQLNAQRLSSANNWYDMLNTTVFVNSVFAVFDNENS